MTYNYYIIKTHELLNSWRIYSKITHTILLFAIVAVPNMPITSQISPIQGDTPDSAVSAYYVTKDPHIREIVAHLATCESGNRSDIRIVDTNGLYSYGLLQFQAETFMGYGYGYKLLPQAEKGEYMNLIYDGEFQKAVAYKMLEEDINNVKHWTICAQRGGYL